MYNSIRKSITLMFLEEEIDAFVDNVGAHAGGHKRGVSIQISIYLGKTFPRISCYTKYFPDLNHTSFHFPDSGLLLLKGFVFILIHFEWRNTENQQ